MSPLLPYISVQEEIKALLNAGVVLVKGANERNEVFEKINKQYIMTNKSG